MQGHSAEERKTVPGKRDVDIIEVLPVGNYAVRLVFDDMHSTGIFGWDYLRELGRNHARLLAGISRRARRQEMARDRRAQIGKKARKSAPAQCGPFEMVGAVGIEPTTSPV